MDTKPLKGIIAVIYEYLDEKRAICKDSGMNFVVPQGRFEPEFERVLE